MQSIVRSFPNAATMFKPAIGDGRLGKPRPPVAKRRIARGSGRIINIASVSGTRAFPPDYCYFGGEDGSDSVQ